MSKKHGRRGELSCSFCGEPPFRKLIAGPTVYICDWCVERCNDILALVAEREANAPAVASPPEPQVDSSRRDRHHHGNLSCTFCGKGQREVRKLIAAPTIYICDECVKRSNDILLDEMVAE